MNFTISCPSCQRTLRVPENLLGQAVKCPSCAHNFSAPEQVEDEAPPRPASDRPSRRRAAPPPEDVYEDEPRPSKSRARADDYEEEYDEAPRRSRRRQHDGVSCCPNCGSTFPPLMKKKIAPAGWVVFATVLAMGLGMCVAGLCLWPLIVVGFICLPLSILGILITTEERVCSECGAKLDR